MLKLFLWLRYLRKKKIVFLSIAAVALSAGLLIVVASLFGGFIDAIEKVGQQELGDIYLNPWVQIPEYGRLVEQIELLPEVEAATVVLDSYGLLHLGGGDVRAVRILGIDLHKYTKVTDFKNSLLSQKLLPGEPGFTMENYPNGKTGFIGIGLLGEPDDKTDQYDFEQIKSWLGRDVVLTTGAVVEKKMEQRFKRKHLKFKIADIAFTGYYFFDSKNVYLPIEQVREQVGADSEVVQIKLVEGVEPKRMIEPIRKVWESFAREHNLPEISVSRPFLGTSRMLLEDIIVELQKQRSVLMLIFAVICSSAVLLIFCIFYMIVETRQKDIGIIKSCGMGSFSVLQIFTGFGVCVGIAGSAFGVLLGYVVTKNINVIENLLSIVFGLKIWKSSVYMLEKIPDQVQWHSVLPIVIAAVAASAVGALIPAIVAARIRPAVILRYE